MTDENTTTTAGDGDQPADGAAKAPRTTRPRRRAASRAAGPPLGADGESTQAAGPDLAEQPGSVEQPSTTDQPRPVEQLGSTERPDAGEQDAAPPAKKATRKRATRKRAEPVEVPTENTPPQHPDDPTAELEPAPAKKATRKRATRKTASVEQPALIETAEQAPVVPAPEVPAADAVAQAPTQGGPEPRSEPGGGPEPRSEPELQGEPEPQGEDAAAGAAPAVALLFQAPETAATPRRRRRAEAPAGPPAPHDTEAPNEPQPQSAGDTDEQSQRTSRRRRGKAASAETSADAGDARQSGAEEPAAAQPSAPQTADVSEDDSVSDDESGGGGRKRRRRGGRGRRGRPDDEAGENGDATDGATAVSDEDAAQARVEDDGAADDEPDSDDEGGSPSSRRRRRRRRRAGSGGGDDTASSEDPPGTVTKVRQPRKPDDEVTSIKGSTRLEAKKQRRRDGRDAGRRKPVITESEFLARRESVERTMIVRERQGRTQIAVLEDDVLVEHYVANETNASMIGNVYLGRVQNVLPSMEAAFIDIGKGRNAVLYAGEVNWDAAGLEGGPRRIEAALKSGDTVLVQVTKDPMGHKGARLTSQISLPGRYLVYVPSGSMTGISRKLPDTERTRLKKILKAVVPEQAGVIVRTAAEGASEEELQRDVERLTAQWADIEKRSTSSSGGSAPKLLHGEPDLTVRVVRDVFNEDFAKLVVSGGPAWEVIQPYVTSVASDLANRISRWTSEDDVFAAHRVDEQLVKAMDRKVWLPSGGSLVIDRTEAMTVVDVNTGKFTGSGGNLEETVTRNNLEAAEEVVRQLRLRDIGGIIVVDFIDMVLEGNRDLVLRRLVECLGRDRTKHQVAEVTSLGLVQMTRKRVGQGLLEVFSESCEHCHGRGVIVHAEPVSSQGNGGGQSGPAGEPGDGRSRGGRSRSKGSGGDSQQPPTAPPAPPRQPIPAGLVASLAHHSEHPSAEPSGTPTAREATTDEVTAEEVTTDVVPVGGAVVPEPVVPEPVVPEPVVPEPVVPEPGVPEPGVPEPSATDVPAEALETLVEEPQPAKAPRRRRRASAPSGPPPSTTEAVASSS